MLQKMSKVKAHDKISFPLELDMQPLLDAADVAGGQQYDLQAILIHRGNNASSGHYGASCARPMFKRTSSALEEAMVACIMLCIPWRLEMNKLAVC